MSEYTITMSNIISPEDQAVIKRLYSTYGVDEMVSALSYLANFIDDEVDERVTDILAETNAKLRQIQRKKS